MSEKKYWQSFGELNNSKAFRESVQNEFREELPFESADNEMTAPRRDFLKYLGFSTAAAALVAGCEIPVRHTVPFLNRPDNVVPGVADYYATSYVQDGEVIPVVAKVRDGRPIKIEGNELSSVFKGGTSARVQASVLDLYDTARLRYPSEKSGNDFKEAPTYEALDAKISGELAGKGIVLLTSTINSPTLLMAINEFLQKFPGSRHVMYDAVSFSGMMLANEACFGKRAIPSYQFDKADVIVNFGADFLGTWLNSVEYAKQYAAKRRLNAKDINMSRHIQFESMLSMTGANADERYTHRPSETRAAVLALYNALNGSAPNLSDKRLNEGIARAAKELQTANGKALVICRSNNRHVQTVINAINEKIGAYGNTINWGHTLNMRKGIDGDMVQFINDMNAGNVGAVLVYGANPAYSYPDATKFADAFKKVPVTISFNDREDETTQLCKYSLPDHNYLESWGDAECKSGYISFIQPAIAPLFKTRPFGTSLLKWSGNAVDDYGVYFKNYWTSQLGGEAAFNKVLQDGVIEPAAPSVTDGTLNPAAVTEAISNMNEGLKAGKYEMVLYQKITIGDGRMASNPWLQETADPISRATWDNYAMVSVMLAAELGYQADDQYEVRPKKPVLKITANGKSLELPLLIIPGMHPDTIAIAVGYGRTGKVGIAAKDVGKNAYPFAVFNENGDVKFSANDVTIEKTDATYPIGLIQTHNVYGDRTEVIKEFSIGHFKSNTHVVLEEREEELKPYGGIEGLEEKGTLYPVYEKPGIKWGMSIDLNTCIGCAACVTACIAENNTPVVGKKQVMKFHDMHWMRIDRYFSGDMENPDVIFQPMLCQHCDNAPCENVCPVGATNHSSEGLNQMIYNRCIGTRYCANNCPYKVRRFNFHDWNGADSFPDNQKSLVDEGWIDGVILDMNDDLTRMVLNPDVTVRSRGVIEKCSFCVQRLQEGKLKAKKEDRPLKDMADVQTACQQACPTNAIVFGNVNDKESLVHKLRNEEQKERSYYVLEQLHVLPNVSYMAKVRNTERQVGNPEEGEGNLYEVQGAEGVVPSSTQ